MILLAFGDSITYGSYVEKGWAEQLRVLLWEREKVDGEYRRMYNLGIPGDTTNGLLKRFEIETKARLNPKHGELVVLIAFGSNDSAFIEPKQEMAVQLEEYQSNLEQVIEQAKALSARIVLLTIPPLAKEGTNGRGKSRSNQDIDTYNKVLKELTETHSLDIIDTHAAFGDAIASFFIEDGLHPNEAGHTLMLEEIKKYFI